MEQLVQQSIATIKTQAINKAPEGASVNSKVKQQEPVLINQTTYSLNKSNSKFVTVGLSSYGGFLPGVKVYGTKNDWMVFDPVEWKVFTDNLSGICNCLGEKDAVLQPVNVCTGKRICFQTIGRSKVIFVQDSNRAEIYLGIESLSTVANLQGLIEYRLELLKSLEFGNFYNAVVNGIASLPGDANSNVENVISNLNIYSENGICMLEMVKFGGDMIRCDIELDRIAQLVN